MTNGTPGSHPHSDRPNWRQAETLDEYLANCREGLEQYSDRRAAKLMGVSRSLPHEIDRDVQRHREALAERTPMDAAITRMALRPGRKNTNASAPVVPFPGGDDDAA